MLSTGVWLEACCLLGFGDREGRIWCLKSALGVHGAPHPPRSSVLPGKQELIVLLQILGN